MPEVAFLGDRSTATAQPVASHKNAFATRAPKTQNARKPPKSLKKERNTWRLMVAAGTYLDTSEWATDGWKGLAGRVERSLKQRSQRAILDESVAALPTKLTIPTRQRRRIALESSDRLLGRLFCVHRSITSPGRCFFVGLFFLGVDK